MKVVNYRLYLLMVLLAVCSLAFVLTGCGATPSGAAQSVYFVSDCYDENGNPLFEVDLDTPVTLTYKVTPSTGVVSPKFSVFSSGTKSDEDNQKNLSRFTMKPTDDLKNEIIIVESEDFDEITIILEISTSEGTISDICAVRLKEYPKKIYLDKNAEVSEKNDIINVSGEYTIHVFGDFAKSQHDIDIREMRDSDFKFLVESADETVLKVMDNSRLKVTTLKKKPESTQLKIYLLDTKGRKFYAPQTDDNGKVVTIEDAKGNKHIQYTDKEDERYILTININVIVPASSADILIEGYDKFIQDGDAIELTAKSTDDENVSGTNYETKLVLDKWVYYRIGYNVDIFSEDNLYIDQSTYSVIITSDQDKFVKVDYDDKKIEIRRPNDKTNSITALITITTSSNNSSGSSFSASFTLTFNFPVS